MRNLVQRYKSISEVLKDHKLAALGDAYVNFIYSLALTKSRGELTGVKVDSRILAEALKTSGLRSLLPSRTNRHIQADAAEALLVYVWMKGFINLQEGVDVLAREIHNPVKAFSLLLTLAKEKLEQRK